MIHRMAELPTSVLTNGRLMHGFVTLEGLLSSVLTFYPKAIDIRGNSYHGHYVLVDT